MKPKHVAPQPVLDLAIWLALPLSIFAVYAQVYHFDFVNYDDSAYVFQNSYVRSGLTPGSIRSASTSMPAGHWVPVTMLSHVLIYQLFGINSGMHHLANVFCICSPRSCCSAR